MNKAQLVKEISNRTHLTQKDILTVIDTFQEVVKDAVANNDKVAITGFITFEKKNIPAKSGTSRLGGVEKSWSTKARDEISAKLSKTYKTI